MIDQATRDRAMASVAGQDEYTDEFNKGEPDAPKAAAPRASDTEVQAFFDRFNEPDDAPKAKEHKEMSFKEAFGQARKGGEKTFDWGGKKYSTALKSEKAAKPAVDPVANPVANLAAKPVANLAAKPVAAKSAPGTMPTSSAVDAPIPLGGVGETKRAPVEKVEQVEGNLITWLADRVKGASDRIDARYAAARAAKQ